MAKISDLRPTNTAGNTKSQYSLLQELVEAVVRINDKEVILFPSDETLEIDVEDGYSYFANVSAQSVVATLPLSSENENMKAYLKNYVDGGLGGLQLAVTGADTIDGVNAAVDLNTAGDYIEVIATSSGWISKYKYVAP